MPDSAKIQLAKLLEALDKKALADSCQVALTLDDSMNSEVTLGDLRRAVAETSDNRLRRVAALTADEIREYSKKWFDYDPAKDAADVGNYNRFKYRCGCEGMGHEGVVPDLCPTHGVERKV